MPNPAKNFKDTSVENRKLHFSSPKNRYVYEDFRGPFGISAQGGGVAVGTTAAVNLMQWGHNRFEIVNLGAGQTAFNPPIVAGGLNIAGDQTSTEGFEITNGNSVRGEVAFTIGTDGPFAVEAELNSDDASSNPLYIGFRRQQAYQTAIASYTDFAVIGLNGAGAPALIKTQTQLNTAGGATTDSGLTLGDGVTKKFRVEVSGAGKVTYYVGGALVSSVPAFTFDATDVVIPFLWFLQNADLAPNVLLSSWRCGLRGEYATPAGW
jgi:hypothetical protein